ncbi:MAG: hypothetical protein FWE99_02050, partial [Bacteroidales bacterium]|nr:hypothetical protein [Bacteroidales bacterium]
MKVRLLALLLLPSFLFAQQPLLSPYELGNQNRTPRLAETIAFCQQLVAATTQVSLTSIGIS